VESDDDGRRRVSFVRRSSTGESPRVRFVAFFCLAYDSSDEVDRLRRRRISRGGLLDRLELYDRLDRLLREYEERLLLSSLDVGLYDLDRRLDGRSRPRPLLGYESRLSDDTDADD
jgi:hypothetical protein